MDYQDQLTGIFLQECAELLDEIELVIVALENRPDDKSLLNRIFRAVHTIKGGAGTVGAESLVQFTHVVENVLDRLRAGEITVSVELATLLLGSADVLRELTQALARGEARVSPTPRREQLLEALRAYSSMVQDPAPQPVQAEEAAESLYRVELRFRSDILETGQDPLMLLREILDVGEVVEARVDTSGLPDLDELDPFKIYLGWSITFRSRRTLDEVRHIFRFVIDENPIKVERLETTALTFPAEAVGRVEAAAPDNIPEHESNDAPETAEPPVETTMVQNSTAEPQDAGRSTSDNSVRVTVRVLDKLMTLAGEMVLTRNQLMQSAGQGDLYLVHRAVQRVDVITMELQDAIMATRMQSVGTVFRKFKRVIRDIAVRLDKSVELELTGEDVELDRTLIEAISEPLTHLVRNAIDHGIERPEVRTKMGKPATGTIRLAATHKAGQVLIEVSDDGQGISTDKLKARALQLGLHSREELNAMNDKMLARLIFSPGLSTAESVSELSGRGVGMDVVLSNLSQIGGLVDVDTHPGQGTTIRIKLPLTLAILPSLLVEAQGERFAIPQVNLVELHRIPARSINDQVELVGHASVLRLRGKLLPLVRLRDVLDMPEQKADDTAKRVHPSLPPGATAMNIAVISAGDFDYGIIVDTLLDTSEIVVKPLGRHLSQCRVYAGATVLGDGRTALILDAGGIGQVVRRLEMAEARRAMRTQSENGNVAVDHQSLLLVQDESDEICGIPLELVERIEKIRSSSIREIRGRQTLVMRGTSLPLFAVNGMSTEGKDRTLFVIVFKVGSREAGLVTREVVDIIEVMAEIDDFTHKQPGVMGSVIHGEQTILLLDVFGIVHACRPEWAALDSHLRVDQEATVLIVDDSRFFRAQIGALVEEAGYRTLFAEDGVRGLELLDKHAREVKLVLTDINMPRLDGLGFAEKVRAQDRFRDLPLMAITSETSEATRRAGIDLGIDDYTIKLSRESLLKRCKHFVENGRVAMQA